MTATGLRGRDLVLVLLICLFWATNFLTSAHALREVPPFLFTAMRMGLLAALLVGFMRVPPRAQWTRLFAVAMLNGVLHFGTSFLALKLAGDLSSPAIVTQVYVPMAVLLAWWVLGERFGWRTGVGVAISFAGVLVLGFDPMVLAQPAALFVMMGSSLMVAIGTVLMRGLKDVRMVDQQGWTAVLSLLPLLAVSAVFEPGSFVALRDASGIAWGAAIYAAVFSSLLGHGVFYWLVQRHPVATVTPYLLLTPVLAIVLGIVFWGDRPGPALWIGGAMVLGGVLVVALRAGVRQRVLPSAEEL
ncbi:DMT family transporter [Thermomonas carbonis]|uniref:DMT family transporter n=1 Tax=Thermomonas carbonis TaxID=1463158 RepID=A0A7G9SU28_9GAMM|nr:DMT family transporter [Thermomonas carbonis]QNN71353.1 DMT family transporter [Thermomonas carbonis]GHC10141.1 membrane protein [Thermomonas carbonis]